MYSKNDIIILMDRWISTGGVWNIHGLHVTAVNQWFPYNLAGGKLYTDTGITPEHIQRAVWFQFTQCSHSEQNIMFTF